MHHKDLAVQAPKHPEAESPELKPHLEITPKKVKLMTTLSEPQTSNHIRMKSLLLLISESEWGLR